MSATARARRPAFALAAGLLLALVAGARAETHGKNLVENPSFQYRGDDPVPFWEIVNRSGDSAFSVERGRLVAERRPGKGAGVDGCQQVIEVPPRTRAFRVRLRAEVKDAGRAELRLAFRDRDGGSLGLLTPVVLEGTREPRLFDEVVLVPPRSEDVTIRIALLEPGRVVVDEIDVRVTDPEDAGNVARRVRISGEVRAARRDADGRAVAAIRIPPATDTQAPVALEVRSRPEGVVDRVTLLPEDGRLTVEAAAGPGLPTIAWSVVVVAAEREDFPSLPSSIQVPGRRGIPKAVRPFLEPAPDFDPPDEALTSLRETTNVAVLAERTARHVMGHARPGGYARLAAALLRAREVPARVLVLLPVDGGGEAREAVEVFAGDHGWLRLGLTLADRRPLPFSADVLLARGGVEVDLPVPPAGAPGLRLAVEESVRLPAGAAPMLLGEIARRLAEAAAAPGAAEGFRIGPEDVRRRGPLRGLDEEIRRLLGGD